MKTQSAAGNALQKGAASRRSRPETKNADHNINPIKIQEVKMGFTLKDGFNNNDDVEITGVDSKGNPFTLKNYGDTATIDLSPSKTIEVKRGNNGWPNADIYIWYDEAAVKKPDGTNCSVGSYDTTHKRALITIDNDPPSFKLTITKKHDVTPPDTTISVGETKPGETGSGVGGQSHKGYKKR